VNEDGPLARLKNLLFNQQTFTDIKNWITVLFMLLLTLLQYSLATENLLLHAGFMVT